MSKILVVDDEFDISEAICAILRADGHEVTVSSNGKEALEYLKSGKQQPELILLDVMMPYLSGYEVLKYIRNQEGLRKTPVILMSSVQPTGAQKRTGFNDFLRKPFDLSTLEKLLSKHL